MGKLIFKTSLGHMGLEWNEKGITRVNLLTKESLKTPARIPTFVKKAKKEIEQYCKTGRENFSSLMVDLQMPPFHKKVCESLRKVPSGKVVSYKELARMAKSPKAFRAVGAAMASNPCPLIVPCHRVIKNDGNLGCFSAPGWQKTKRKLLELEGIQFPLKKR